MRVRSVLACFAVGVFLAGGGYLAHAGLSRVQFGPGRIVPVTPPEVRIAPRSRVSEATEPPPARSSLPPPGGTFEIDVSRSIPDLDRLPLGERREQLADWVAYAVLARAGLSPTELRDATYDRLPVRGLGFDDAVNVDYGWGRRVVLPDDSVLLVRSARDPRPEATVARLADQVRMERGAVPSSFAILVYETDLDRGTIRVRREADVSGDAMFSEAHGYHERVVADAADLAAFLAKVDDLTHVRRAADPTGGAIVVGGRRIASAPTAGLSLDDVAALYQAHAELKRRRERIDVRLREAGKPVADAYEALVAAFNRQVDAYNRNNFTTIDEAALDEAARALRAVLSTAGAHATDPVPDSREPAGVDDLLERLRAGRSGGGRSNAAATALGRWRKKIDALEAAVSAAVGAEQEKVARQLRASKDPDDRPPPSEPGFSLDPELDVTRLRRNLDFALGDLGAWRRSLQSVVAAAKGDEPEEVAEAHESIRVRRARAVVEASDEAGATASLTAPLSAALRELRAQLGDPSSVPSGDDRDRVLVRLHELKDDVIARASKSDDDASRARAVLELAVVRFLLDDSRIQRARYDGPLQGTRVGMILFYTDLLAKVWSSVDYHRSAPEHEVPGFISQPRHDHWIEPTYWAEVRAKPSTRLWFGPRKEGYSVVEDGREIDFSHVATRVYAAGSNPLRPSEESVPAEPSRRCFAWWDRHFADVADYEQRYHEQNQIMKWSVVTGWLVADGLLKGLSDVPVVRLHQFDRWLEDEKDHLRFSKDVRLLPRSEWTGVPVTESMEILASYGYVGMGGSWEISGGVSLGGKQSLEEGSRIVKEVRVALRRPGLSYGKSAADSGSMELLKGTKFELPKATSKVVLEVPPSIPLRARGLQWRPSVAPSVGIDAAGPSTAFRLSTAEGRLSDVALRAGPTSVELATVRRGLGRELDRVQAFGAVLTETRDAASALARDARFLPGRGAYLVESTEGEVLAVLRDGADARLLRRARGTVPPPNDVVLESGHASLLQHLGLADPTFVQVARSPRVPEALRSTPVQRLRSIRGSARDGDGVVERVFVSEMPAGDGAAVRLRLSDGAADIEGRVVEDALYLRGDPSSGDFAAFCDVVTERHLTGGQVDEWVARAKAAKPGETVEVSWRTDTARESGRRSAVGVLDGADVEPPLAALEESLRRGESAAFSTGTTDVAMERGLRALEDGRPSDATRLFRRARELARGDARAVPEALEVAIAGDKARAVEQVERALRSGALASSGDDVGRAFEAVGEQELADYVRLRSGRLPDVPESLRGGATQARVDGRRVRLSTELPSDVPVYRADDARVQSVRDTLRSGRQPDSVDVYVDVDARAGGATAFDFDEMPGATVAHAFADARHQWGAVPERALGPWRPNELRVGGRTFVRRGQRAAGGATVLLVFAAGAPPLAPPPDDEEDAAAGGDTPESPVPAAMDGDEAPRRAEPGHDGHGGGR
ncbi:MAG: hypothetical protein IT460_05710 [Planctomycetes bacterium]|nr:hypothetical protein [Planctomycetota bacterium]